MDFSGLKVMGNDSWHQETQETTPIWPQQMYANFIIFVHQVVQKWHKMLKWHLDAFQRSDSYRKRFLAPKNIGIDTNLSPVNICRFYNFCSPSEWLKSGTKWHLDGFQRPESYGKRFLVSKNTGIDTNLALVNICQFYNFGHRLAQKWHKMALRCIFAV